MMCIVRPDFEDIREQPEAVDFIDEAGKKRSHHFDYLFTSCYGTISAIAVRPFEKATTEYRRMLARVADAMPPDFADRVVLVTERSYCRNRLKDTERYLGFHAFEDNEADQRLAMLSANTLDPVDVETLVAQMELGHRGLSAIFRAVIGGTLKKQSALPLDYQSMVFKGDLR